LLPTTNTLLYSSQNFKKKIKIINEGSRHLKTQSRKVGDNRYYVQYYNVLIGNYPKEGFQLFERKTSSKK